MSAVPHLDGVHHIKLPVGDLARSLEWYESRLGYRLDVEFRTDGRLIGLAMRHPMGGPTFALQLNPDMAKAASGFDYFVIGVPSKDALEALADHLSELGEEHGGVKFGAIGWNLPLLHDPDGHEIRFYTTAHHTDLPESAITTVNNPQEEFKRREIEYQEKETVGNENE
ncbi:VOC family protein [Nocardia sp. NPDC059091]|uniref:VOC family protein n=1 Tax=unclassified Nocardia TaxID=2637762 RepID=UPI00369A7D32